MLLTPFRMIFSRRKAVIILLKTWREALVDYNRRMGSQVRHYFLHD